MTAQTREKLYYKGIETEMASEPLRPYLENRNDIKFVGFWSSCWRGYNGQWEISENKLHLIGLKAYVSVGLNLNNDGFKVVGLNYLFPEKTKVFADWFSGIVIIPQDQMIKYVHSGFDSIYERDLILTFNKGVLQEEFTIDNHEESDNG